MPRILIHPDGRQEMLEAPTALPEIPAPRLADGTVLGSDGLPMGTTPPVEAARTPRPRRPRAAPAIAPTEEAAPPPPDIGPAAAPGVAPGVAPAADPFSAL
jgi:hypothetical protein